MKYYALIIDGEALEVMTHEGLFTERQYWREKDLIVCEITESEFDAFRHDDEYEISAERLKQQKRVTMNRQGHLIITAI